MSSLFQETITFSTGLVPGPLNWSAKSYPGNELKPQVLGPWDWDPFVLERCLGICIFKTHLQPQGNYYYHSSVCRICVEDKIIGFRATLPRFESLFLDFSTEKFPDPHLKQPPVTIAQHATVIIYMITSGIFILFFLVSYLLSVLLNSPPPTSPQSLCGGRYHALSI